MEPHMTLLNLREKCITCVKGYRKIIPQLDIFGATGDAERLALDGVRFMLLCRVFGISTAQYDPVLIHYGEFMFNELSNLACSFGKVTGCVDSVDRELGMASTTQQEDGMKYSVPVSWITEAAFEFIEIHVGEFQGEREVAIVLPETRRRQVAGVMDASPRAIASLDRLLSKIQRKKYERGLEHWQTKVLISSNIPALQALQNALGDPSDRSHSLSLEADQRLHLLAEDIGDKKISSLLIQKLHMRSEDLRLIIPQEEQQQHLEVIFEMDRSHQVSTFHGKPVLVEKRRNVESAAEGAKAIQIFLRVNCLAERMAKVPKPPALCTLDLLRVFSDRTDQNYGFVYAWPWDIGDWNTDMKPKSLHQLLLENNEETLYVGPSLTKRFEIAEKLAKSVKTFHRIGWLHKSISSHNVLFFPRNLHKDLFEEESNMFLVGFEYSREDGHNSITEAVTKEGTHDIYRHPDVSFFERRSGFNASSSKKFEKSHDLYALGLLLMEIGLWDTLDNVLQQQDYGREAYIQTPTPEEAYKQLIKADKRSVESLLRFHAGDRYAEATMMCLRGGFRDGIEYFDNFQMQVLEPLGHHLV